MIIDLTENELRLCEVAIGVIACDGVISSDSSNELIAEAEQAREKYMAEYNQLFDSHPDIESLQLKLKAR